MKRDQNIRSGFKARRNNIKRGIIRMVFFILGRATQSASRREPLIREEAAPWPDGFTLAMRTLPDGPSLGFKKQEGRLRLARIDSGAADLVIYISTVRTAFRMFTARMSIHGAYSEHRVRLQGNVSDGMRFIRIMTIVQSYLFPKILSSKILKYVTPMTPRRWLRRVWIYIPGLLFGV